MATLEFPHFAIYWQLKSPQFNKKADALALFVHWCMVHHRFKYDIVKVCPNLLELKF